MKYKIEASCGCHIGRIRSNNEDNFYFNGRILQQDHISLRHPACQQFTTDTDVILAVFDGMGGEEHGEIASFVAANTMMDCHKALQRYIKSPRDFLKESCDEMNERICKKAKELNTTRMGSTVVSLFFSSDEIYSCNIGDSKAFRMRDGELLQLSQDHIDFLPLPGMEAPKRKPRLSQHLGIPSEELRLVPYIAKGELKAGDLYLICSDGLTDMLSNVEICAILKESNNIKECVDKLIEKALSNGGKDNITLILCRIQ